MNNEISEEAKTALADLPRRKALQRLERDGATSTKAVQRRVRAIAEERKIPPADFHKLMHKRILTGPVLAFCDKHKISIDWLMCGDLRGLARMERQRKEAAAAASHPGGSSGDFLKAYCGLNEKTQALVVTFIRELARKQGERQSAPDEPA